MPIDLNIFCSKAEHSKSRFGVPWSEGAFSYASDGAILIRVCRLPDIPENKFAPSLLNDKNITGVLNMVVYTWFPVPDITPENKTCVCCGGMKPYCDECDWTGYIEKKTIVEIEGVFFNNKYFRTILTLTEAEMALIGKAGAPAKFKFNGGDGLLMPMLAPGRYSDVKIVIVNNKGKQ